VKNNNDVGIHQHPFLVVGSRVTRDSYGHVVVNSSVSFLNNAVRGTNQMYSVQSPMVGISILLYYGLDEWYVGRFALQHDYENC
jgi:hypothetical protein